MRPERFLVCALFSLAAIQYCAAQVRIEDETQPSTATLNTVLLQTTITLDHVLYVPGEVATVTISVKNPKDQPLEVIPPFWPDGGACLDLWEKGARAAEFGVEFTSVRPEPCSESVPWSNQTAILQPGEVATRTIRTNQVRVGKSLALVGGTVPTRALEYRLSYSYAPQSYAQFRVVDPTIEQFTSLPLGEITETADGESTTFPRMLYGVVAVIGDKRLILHSIGARRTVTREDLDRFGIAELAPLNRVAEVDGALTGLKLFQQTDGTIHVQWADSASAWHDAAVTEPFENYPTVVTAPSFAPIPGTYSTAQNVTIRTPTSGTSIRYTIDGSSPSATAGAVYSAPVPVNTTTTIRAIAYAAGMTDSPVASATYSINLPPPPVAAPTFSPAGGSYTSPQTVTLGTATPGASIRYTTNGTPPSATAGTLYSSPIPVNATTTITAIAYAPGMSDSPVVPATYTVSATTIAAPTNLTGTLTTSSNQTPQVNLSWSYTQNPANPATGFRVSRTAIGDTMSPTPVAITRTSFTDTSLLFGTTYTFRVTAHNTGGESAPSNEVTFTTPPAPSTPLAAPTGLSAPSALVTTTAVTLIWTGVTGATLYAVQSSIDGGQAWQDVGFSWTIVRRVTGLTTKTTYLFRVIATNGNPAAISPPSGAITVTTK